MREEEAQGRDGAADDIALVVRIGSELLAMWEAAGDRRLVPSVLPADERKDGADREGRAAQDHDTDKQTGGIAP